VAARAPLIAARLALLVGLLAACRSEAGGAPPAFAADLPGHTVAVLWSAGGSTAQLDDWVARLPPAVREDLVTPAPGVLAVPGPAGAVAWRTLADSSLFRDASASLQPGWDYHAYVDLTQLVGILRQSGFAAGGEQARGMARLAGALQQRAIDALFLAGFEYACMGLRVSDRGLDARGWIATTGTRAGLPGLLRSPMRGHLPVYAGAAVQLRAHVAVPVVIDVYRQLTRSGGPGAILAQLLQGSLIEHAVAALNALDGRVSATVDAGGAGFVVHLGVADDARLAETLERIGDGLDAPGGAMLGRVRIQAEPGLLTLRAGTMPAAASEAATSTHHALWCRLASPEAEAVLTFDLDSAVPGRIAADVDVRLRE
jgi:hypothetical protein